MRIKGGCMTLAAHNNRRMITSRSSNHRPNQVPSRRNEGRAIIHQTWIMRAYLRSLINSTSRNMGRRRHIEQRRKGMTLSYNWPSVSGIQYLGLNRILVIRELRHVNHVMGLDLQVHRIYRNATLVVGVDGYRMWMGDHMLIWSALTAMVGGE